MRKQIIFLLTIFLGLSSYAQISFEKGYFIDNNNQKTECLIKNADWLNNPAEFEYKLSEKDEAKKGNIKSVKEFSVDRSSKYMRYEINIDRSKENIDKLSNQRAPVFKKETLFLKVLVEGKSNLYEYRDSNIKRYFYTNEDSIVNQLIYKKYKTDENKIAVNNEFKKQIWDDLKCPDFNLSKIKDLNYSKKELVQVFIEYNECHDYSFINYESKQKRDLFNLTVRPRVNSSSLSVGNTDIFSDHTLVFDNKIGFGIGIESEFILPFNKNKWAILIEATYQSFQSEASITDVDVIFGGELHATIDYSSIELPLGVRHYFFLNENSKIFVNASIVFDISLKSSFEGELANGSPAFTTIENSDTRENFAFGLGYKLHDKYNVEMRYQTSRSIIGKNELSNWDSDYRTISLIFGYSFL